MKLSFAKASAFTLLITTISFLNGEEGEELTLFVDSINLQVMTDLTISGKDDPLTIAHKSFYRVPFSQENLSFSISRSFSSEKSITLFLPESSFPEKNVTFYLPEMSFPEEDIALPSMDSSLPEEDIASSPTESSLPDDSIMPPSTESSLPEDAEEAVKAIYHFLLEHAPSGNYTFKSINQLQSQIVSVLKEAGYYGVAVVVDPDQIDMQTGDDYRQEDDNSLNLQIWIGEVVSQRTVAKGKRIKEGSLINHPYHEKVIVNSPFAPGSELNASGEFLIHKSALDNYLERLNQSPNRRVDVAVSSAGEPGKLVLDYVVNEPKPWLAYVQVSNTGTEATGEWRERIGGVHYQLTNNDDVLSVDYLTAEFDRANALLANYEYPLLKPNYLNLVASASYSDFAAENLVIPNLPDSEGETISFSSELVYTPFYFKEHAISFGAGLLFEDIDFETSGLNPVNVNLLSPYLKFEVSKQKQLHRSRFLVSYEKNIDDGDDDEDKLVNMGRLESTVDYEIVRFDFYQSFFVEPLLPAYYKVKPEKWLANSLIHELAFSLRGQYTLDDARLITQKQVFGGGFFSVRGYNESAARGDSGIIGSAEYRFHLARVLKPSSMLKEVDPEEQASDQRVRNRFNYRAPSLYGFPDWDLMMRGFIDWANFSFNEATTDQIDEIDQDLTSIGIGLEFQYKANLNIRVDYGIVRKTLRDFDNEPIDDADRGDSRFHFLATYSF